MAADTERRVDNPAAHRYEAYRGDTLVGFADYRLADGVLAVSHVETVPAYEGQGVASKLAAHLLADARRRGLTVAPYCEFLRAYLRRNPEHRDLVATGFAV